MLDYIVAIRNSTTHTYHIEGLWFLLPDDLLPLQYQKPRPNETQGWPQTVNITTARETIPMTEAIQRWLYALNPGLPASSFADIFDTWNTGSKIRDNANFITGERLNGELPKYPCNLLMGCNVVMQKDIVIRNGIEFIEIETVNPKNLPDIISLPIWLKQHLTIIHPALYAGRKKVNPFDHNGGGRNGGKPCYTALLAAEPVYIESARCREVATIPNPYNPAWSW
mgnify:CR=1 FL=1